MTQSELNDVLDQHKRWLNSKGAKGTQAYLAQTDMPCLSLAEADLRSANLSEANLKGADLSYAKLDNANLSDAILFDANLDSATLVNANLQGADLAHANLTSTQCYDTDFIGAELTFAKLIAADLSFADLCMADMENANLRAAILEGTILQEAKILYTEGLYRFDSSSFRVTLQVGTNLVWYNDWHGFLDDLEDYVKDVTSGNNQASELAWEEYQAIKPALLALSRKHIYNLLNSSQ